MSQKPPPLPPRATTLGANRRPSGEHPSVQGFRKKVISLNDSEALSEIQALNRKLDAYLNDEDPAEEEKTTEAFSVDELTPESPGRSKS